MKHNRTLSRLETLAKRLELQLVPKLDKTIERAAADQTVVLRKYDDVIERLSAERAATVDRLDKAINKLSNGRAATVDRLDKAINKLSNGRADVAQLCGAIMQFVAKDRIEVEHDRMQDARVGTELEQIRVENEQQQLAILESQLAAERAAAGANRLSEFIEASVHHAPGHLLTFKEFYERFIAWLPESERGEWSRVRVPRELPERFAAATGNQNKTYIINASWSRVPPRTPYYVAANRRLKR